MVIIVLLFILILVSLSFPYFAYRISFYSPDRDPKILYKLPQGKAYEKIQKIFSTGLKKWFIFLTKKSIFSLMMERNYLDATITQPTTLLSKLCSMDIKAADIQISAAELNLQENAIRMYCLLINVLTFTPKLFYPSISTKKIALFPTQSFLCFILIFLMQF